MYFEACNCSAVCPCRRIDGVAGGRSTHGVCLGVLTWLIESGRAGAVDLSGLAAALALRYSDDEAGSPWQYHLYVDARGNAGPETVSRVIPGHDQPGEELIAAQVQVEDGSLQFEITGTAGYASVFEYHSAASNQTSTDRADQPQRKVG